MKTPASFGRTLMASILLVLAARTASAHYCGPPVIRCRPGDIVTYYIISDMAEFGDSFYAVDFQDNPGVAPVVYYTPVARVAGMYVFVAQQYGINGVDLHWSFPPNFADGVCFVDIVVQPDLITTAGEYPYSSYAGDPVNMFTGELVLREPADLNLGGPMPLFFRRYYASRLQTGGAVNSRLGNNWSHNFDWRAVLVVTNKAVIVSPEGLQVKFDQSGTNWVLQSPTNYPFQLVNSGTDVVFGDPRDQRLFRFDTNGLLIAISDGKGNTHALMYTNNFLLAQVSDGLGRALTFAYAGPRFLRTVSDGTRTNTFFQIEVGDDFNLLSSTDPLGHSTTYAYDNSKEVGSLLISKTYPAGNVDYAQVYDNEGRVIQQTRFGSNLTSFSYDTNSLVTTASNAQGQVNLFAHSHSGQFLSLTDSSGNVVALGTNTQGRANSITDRFGGTVRIAYDPLSGKPVAQTNTDGTVTQFTYTNRTVMGIRFYELSSVALPDGAMEQFDYDAGGNLLATTDRAGNRTRMGYNARGQLTAITNPAGGVVTYTYNADGTQAARADAETGTTGFFYDSLGRLTNALASDGASLRTSFDLADRIISIIDEQTNTTVYAYDNNDRLTAITNTLGRVTAQFSYDDGNRLTNVTDALDRRTTSIYDLQDRLTTVTNRNGNRYLMGFNSQQRQRTVTDPAGRNWSIGQNIESVPVSFTDPLGNVLRHAVDAAGFVTATTNAQGQAIVFGRDAMHRLTTTVNSLGQLDQYRHDSRGLLTNTTFSAVGSASYAMNELGLLTNLTDQIGSQWKFSYTPLGRLSSIVDPLGRSNAVSYDGRGRAWRFAYADGSAQTNNYDLSGNLNRLNFSDGTNITFDYDALHRLTNAPGLLLAYDALNRVTNTTSSGINFGASYDPDGRLTNVTYNDGEFSVAYAYDSRDRLVQVRDSLTSARLDFFYDDAGRLTNAVRANSANGIYDYDPVGRVTRIREGSFMDLQYALNAAGEIASLSATTPLSLAPAAGNTNALTFDAGHQISSSGYGYDARGRLIASPARTFAWNAASQLVRAGALTNGYNGAGNLVTRAVAPGTTRYHYNHAIGLTPIVGEQNAGTGRFERYYVWTPGGQLLYLIDAAGGNAVSYFHFDRVGSTLALTDAAGTVTDAYAYSAYGILVARTGASLQPFTYIGRFGVRYDPQSGLYQMRGRYYDPATARFLSRDPVWPRPGDPLSLNPYNYAANNPLLYVDPSGADLHTTQITIEARIVQTELSSGLNLGIRYNLDAYGGAPMATGQGFERLPGESDLSPVREPAGWNRMSMLEMTGSRFRPMTYLKPLLKDLGTGPGNRMLAGFGVDQYRPNSSYYCRPPQPISPVSPIVMMFLGTEMLGVNVYSALLNVQQHTRPSGVYSAGAWFVAASIGVHPDILEPRGLAFVNGRMVEPKIEDIIRSVYWYDDYYRWLQCDYYPGDSPYCWFGDSTLLGGSGGLYLQRVEAVQ